MKTLSKAEHFHSDLAFIQTVHKESNFGQRLPVDLKVLTFIFKHLFIDKTTTW